MRDQSPNQPAERSILERPPLLRGKMLAGLIFVLWLPLMAAVAAVSLLIELSLPLIGAAVLGTLLSVGLAIGALRSA